MGDAYSGGGLQYRLSRSSDDLRNGEVYFEEPATEDQLAATFPNYEQVIASRAAASWAATARQALEASDRVVLRCYEASIPVPEEWVTYRRALRGIAAGTAADYPVAPAYPVGT